MENAPEIVVVFYATLIIFGLVVGIAWLIFPFRIISRMDKMLSDMKEVKNELSAIRLGVTPVPPSAPEPTPAPQSESVKPLDFVSCRCNHCSNELSFNANDFQPGQTTVCPKCGLETQLFVPQALADLIPAVKP